MPKHMPAAPIANRSQKGPGDHQEVASDTTSQEAPGRTEHFRAGRNGEHQAEHDKQGLLPRKANEIARRSRNRFLAKLRHS